MVDVKQIGIFLHKTPVQADFHVCIAKAHPSQHFPCHLGPQNILETHLQEYLTRSRIESFHWMEFFKLLYFRDRSILFGWKKPLQDLVINSQKYKELLLTPYGCLLSCTQLKHLWYLEFQQCRVYNWIEDYSIMKGAILRYFVSKTSDKIQTLQRSFISLTRFSYKRLLIFMRNLHCRPWPV